MIHVKGINSKESGFEVNIKSDGNVTGAAMTHGPGMPVHERGERVN